MRCQAYARELDHLHTHEMPSSRPSPGMTLWVEGQALKSRGAGSSDVQMRWGAASITVLQGDITLQDVDAVVNAANSSLMGGGGVDGAIHRRGGPTILEECKRIRSDTWPGGLPSGKAVITTGGLLRARHVIHTVGPVWRGGGHGEASVLAECYTSSLALAKENRLASVAFPAISTGAYGYPIKAAARVALATVKGCVERENQPRAVNFVLFSSESLRAYQEVAAGMV